MTLRQPNIDRLLQLGLSGMPRPWRSSTTSPTSTSSASTTASL